MKGLIKKSIGITMAVVMLVITGMSNIRTVRAADRTFIPVGPSQDDTYYVSYDKNKYQIYWVSRVQVTSRSQYGSMWADLDKGDKLGTATIRVYYLEPKSAVENNYYAMAGCQVSMDPINLKGNVTGMAQMADFRLKTINADSRVCSPTVDLLNIQASKTSNSSLGFTAGTGVKYNFTKKEWETSGEFNFVGSWGSASAYTYNMTNVNLTQKNKNGAYASWCYDYKSKDKNPTWNAYLMSSSKVAGQVVYRLNGKPTSSNRRLNVPTELSYDIRFGAGNIATGKVANRLGVSTNRDMSVITKTITMSY